MRTEVRMQKYWLEILLEDNILEMEFYMNMFPAFRMCPKQDTILFQLAI